MCDVLPEGGACRTSLHSYDALLANYQLTQAETPDLVPKGYPALLADGLDQEVLASARRRGEEPARRGGSSMRRPADSTSRLGAIGAANGLQLNKPSPAKECRPAPVDVAKSPPEEAGL